ncbi:MAG: tetratricopeptide repeat protein [Candidatus Aminicenantes bacterium]|nr:tetratricopeptide repeat protein [Candidatus Aminicenantes bacterium]
MKTDKKKVIMFSAALLLILGIAAVLLYTQSQSRRGEEKIKGVVIDKDGKPIEAAIVAAEFKGYYRTRMGTREMEFEPVSGADAHIKFELKTDKKGEFRFINLGYGQWQVAAAYGDLEPAMEIVILHSSIHPRTITLKLLEKVMTPTTPPPGATFSSGDLPTELDEETKKILKDPKKLFALGEQLLLDDELENAIRCFSLSAQLKPDWSAPYLKLGYTYFNLGETKKALEYFRKFLELDPKSPDAPAAKEIVEIFTEEK